MQKRNMKINIGLVVSALAATLALAACGGGSSKSTASSAINAADTTASSGAVSGVTLSTASGSTGTFLTASNRALYLWVADPSGQSSCSGQCAKVWPPLTTNGAPRAAGKVSS